MANENDMKTSNAAGPSGTESPVESPVEVPALSVPGPDGLCDRYPWTGEGPQPRRWVAADGTVVYRSYADYCND